MYTQRQKYYRERFENFTYLYVYSERNYSMYTNTQEKCWENLKISYNSMYNLRETAPCTLYTHRQKNCREDLKISHNCIYTLLLTTPHTHLDRNIVGEDLKISHNCMYTLRGTTQCTQIDRKSVGKI